MDNLVKELNQKINKISQKLHYLNIDNLDNDLKVKYDELLQQLNNIISMKNSIDIYNELSKSKECEEYLLLLEDDIDMFVKYMFIDLKIKEIEKTNNIIDIVNIIYELNKYNNGDYLLWFLKHKIFDIAYLNIKKEIKTNYESKILLLISKIDDKDFIIHLINEDLNKYHIDSRTSFKLNEKDKLFLICACEEPELLNKLCNDLDNIKLKINDLLNEKQVDFNEEEKANNNLYNSEKIFDKSSFKKSFLLLMTTISILLTIKSFKDIFIDKDMHSKAYYTTYDSYSSLENNTYSKYVLESDLNNSINLNIEDSAYMEDNTLTYDDIVSKYELSDKTYNFDIINNIDYNNFIYKVTIKEFLQIFSLLTIVLLQLSIIIYNERISSKEFDIVKEEYDECQKIADELVLRNLIEDKEINKLNKAKEVLDYHLSLLNESKLVRK